MISEEMIRGTYIVKLRSKDTSRASRLKRSYKSLKHKRKHSPSASRRKCPHLYEATIYFIFSAQHCM